MKQLILGMMLGAALLTGCASSHYVITLTNGYRIVAAGKPKLDTEHLAFVFTDLNGRSNSIPSVRVRAIAPASNQPSAK
jgi:major membrane immunogen (membrane-anchored lipoprotein)